MGLKPLVIDRAMLFSPQRLVELIEYTDRLRTSNREIPFWQIRDWSQKYL